MHNFDYDIISLCYNLLKQNRIEEYINVAIKTTGHTRYLVLEKVWKDIYNLIGNKQIKHNLLVEFSLSYRQKEAKKVFDIISEELIATQYEYRWISKWYFCDKYKSF